MHWSQFLLAVALVAQDYSAGALPPLSVGTSPSSPAAQRPRRSVDGSRGCFLSCAFLNWVLQGTVSYPQSSIYGYETSRYWSQQQAAAHPTCRVSPTCAADVSITVQVLESLQCRFAVKSGGHGAFYGTSNINDGVTIDLRNLNEVSVAENRTVTRVGSGNRWHDVYSKLSPLGLAVVGGRVADIGVGGLTLGGGISFFSGRHGWACDGVQNYEVVFADGAIRNVNQYSHPDIYWALRGGGNNFGIITRFDLMTFPQGGMWGGQAIHYQTDQLALNQAFEDFNINSHSDPDAAMYLAYAWVQSANFTIIDTDLVYSKPVPNPPIFKNFTALAPFQSTFRLTNLVNLTLELNASNPGGSRQTYWTFTFKNSASFMNELVQIWTEELAPIKTAKDVLPSLILQPITTSMISHFNDRGGNALGISEDDGPLTLVNVDISWSSSIDDSRILTAARNVVNRGVTAAKACSLDHPYLYQNYAAQEQNVFDSYGVKNKERLLRTHRQIDPKGVFTKLQPGYFKIT